MSSGVISFNVGSQMNPMWCWTLAIYVAFPTNMKVCYGVKNKISGIFQLAGRGKGIWAGHAVYHYTIYVLCSTTTIPNNISTRDSLETRMIGKSGK